MFKLLDDLDDRETTIRSFFKPDLLLNTATAQNSNLLQNDDIQVEKGTQLKIKTSEFLGPDLQAILKQIQVRRNYYII